jgi:hypothetical protein
MKLNARLSKPWGGVALLIAVITFFVSGSVAGVFPVDDPGTYVLLFFCSTFGLWLTMPAKVGVVLLFGVSLLCVALGALMCFNSKLVDGRAIPPLIAFFAAAVFAIAAVSAFKKGKPQSKASSEEEETTP